MKNLKLSDETFGILLPFVKNKDITDIRWDGHNLWIDDLTKGKYKTDIKLEDKFIKQFTQRIADLSNVNFNNSAPCLEGETDNLRIAVLNESVTNTGTAITIRKTEPECRLNEENIIESGYCDENTVKLLQALVKARCSFVVTGDTGSGKTELIKFLLQSVPDEETTLTVEDNFELRAKALRPKFDCTEIKVTDVFPYDEAIKAALRQNTKYLVLSESRGREASFLLEAASTGCTVLTSIHTLDVKNIPDRFENMVGETNNDIKNDVHSYFDVGIMIVKNTTPKGIVRHINQVCLFERKNGVNKIHILIDNGEWTKNLYLPDKIRKKFKLYDIEIPKFMEVDCNV